jgi:transcriptional regulator with XRE-family HTH domain
VVGRKKLTQDPETEDADMELATSIGRQVRKLRTVANLSQRQLAEAAKVSHPYIVTVESGIPNVSVSMLAKLARVIGVPVTAFFEDIEQQGDPIDPVLARLASELHRIANSLDSRRDAIGSLLQDLEQAIEKRKK